jgi:hypothetical protein
MVGIGKNAEIVKDDFGGVSAPTPQLPEEI